MAHRQLQLRPRTGGEKHKARSGPVRSVYTQTGLNWMERRCGENNEGKEMDEKTGGGGGSDSEGGEDGGGDGEQWVDAERVSDVEMLE